MGAAETLGPCLERARRRRRARHALEGLAYGVLLSSAGATLFVAWHRFQGEQVPWSLLLAGAGLLAACVTGVAALRRVRLLDVAIDIDQHHGLHSALATGVELSGRALRTSFERAALEVAEAHAAAIDPLAPFPFRAPRATKAALAVATLFALTVATPPRTHLAAPLEDETSREQAPLLEPDVLAAFEEALRDDEGPPASDEVEEISRAIESLLSDIAEGSIEKADALARLGEISAELSRERGLDARTLEAELGEMGEALAGGGKLLEDTAEKLREGKLAEASRRLREAASALDAQKVISTRERLAMKKALERSASTDGALERATQAREEAERSLLERERRAGQSEEERSLLKRKERELEELRREEESLREDRRRLERLRRELDRAAESMGDDARGDASDALRRAAEALRDLEQLRQSARDIEALRRLAEQLRDSIRQSGQGGEGQGEGEGGQGRGERMQRFSLRAGGDEAGEGQTARLRLPGQPRDRDEGDPGQGQQGQGQQGQGQQGQGQQEGQQGQGQQGQGQQGQGQQGQGGTDGQADRGSGEERAQGGRGQPSGDGEEPGSKGEPTLELTPAAPGQRATAELEIPSLTRERASGGGGAASGEGSSSHGDGHDPSGPGEESSMRVAHEESRVEGELGQGPTRSQLILGAADRGFATRGYRKVHADYSSHAEELLEDESIPPGYRFYVRRYFQLIRPRDDQSR